tara:strand:+ start:5040 stop:5180 length:141 start_codon:yes stop_codon:yes gene_type:complete
MTDLSHHPILQVDFTKLGLQSLAKYLQKGMGILVSIMEDEQVCALT